MTAPRLIWRPVLSPDGIPQLGGWAYSGKLVVGWVAVRIDGSYFWTINAVHTRHIVKGSGDAKSVAAGRRALTRAWRIWCDKAGLVHKQ